MSITEEKGSISVNTENLFPIIKKWLYSEHDIFLRELISNASDACTKLERLSALGKYEGDVPAPIINIQIDKTAKTITISDNGLGMSAEEIKKYINQIAFSGAKDFLEKYKDGSEETQIIGHFGMGFFSSFMVSDDVEINSKSFQKDSSAIHWRCDGSTEFSMKAGNREHHGTDIILHINKDSEEFLEETKIKELVTRYSNFLNAEIQVNGQKANEQNALWNKAASSITDEEYKEFYKKLFPYQPDPLFWVHFTVDYPFNLKGILFFPKISNEFEVKNQGRIKLFCNNVFVSDNIIDIIPPYLNLLQGVIDSPDIPLNVSRSFLQGDPKVKKIGEHIVSKIAGKLTDLNKNEKEKYTGFWKDINPFIKYGVISDEKFYEKVKSGLIFQTVDGESLTLEEYKKKNEKAKDKVIYTTDKEAQISYIQTVKSEGVDIVIMDSPLDNHFMQHLEMKESPTRFVRVDSGIGETLLHEDELKKDDKEEVVVFEKELCELFKHHITNEQIEVTAREFKTDEFSAMITQQEFMRRFSDMSSLMEGKRGGKLMSSHSLVLNTSNPVIKKMKELSKTEADSERIKEMCKTIYDLALIQQSALTGEALSEFIKRSNKLIATALG